MRPGRESTPSVFSWPGLFKNNQSSVKRSHLVRPPPASRSDSLRCVPAGFSWLAKACRRRWTTMSSGTVRRSRPVRSATLAARAGSCLCAEPRRSPPTGRCLCQSAPPFEWRRSSPLLAWPFRYFRKDHESITSSEQSFRPGMSKLWPARHLGPAT